MNLFEDYRPLKNAWPGKQIRRNHPKYSTEKQKIWEIKMALFAKLEKCILKFILNHKRSKIDKTILKNRNKRDPHFLISKHITSYSNRNRLILA